MSTSLGHLPTSEKWTFDTSVVDCFGDMLERSIPQYQTMRQLVFDLGTQYVHAGDTIIDLGCSCGDALEPFVRRYGARCTYHGIEVSQPMLDAARQRFAHLLVSDAYGQSEHPQVHLTALDLRTQYLDVQATLTLAVLTLMFLPLERRPALVQRIYDHTLPGGAVLVIEKVLGSSAQLDAILVERYHAMKQQHGYTSEEVERKRLALEGVLVPLSAAWNESLLRSAGFAEVECIWRCLNFAGWLALKGE